MSTSKTIADEFLVTAVTPRVHVRHLAVNGWVQSFSPDANALRIHPLCGTGDTDSRYKIAQPEHDALPVCKRCIHRFAEYAENLTAAGVTW